MSDFTPSIKSEFEKEFPKPDDPLYGPIYRELRLEGAKWMAERCSAISKDFSWKLPIFKTEHENNITDDVACAVSEQISEAIRQLAKELS